MIAPILLLLAAAGCGVEPLIQGTTFNGASVLGILLLGVCAGVVVRRWPKETDE